MPNPITPTWNLNEYCHYHQKSGHKTENFFHLKHEIHDLIDNGTLPNPNIIIKPNIRKKTLCRITIQLLLYIKIGQKYMRLNRIAQS